MNGTAGRSRIELARETGRQSQIDGSIGRMNLDHSGILEDGHIHRPVVGSKDTLI